jgi:hypothetical protein
MTWDHICATVTYDTIVAFVIPLAALQMSTPVKNTFGMSVYYKEYTFPILLIPCYQQYRYDDCEKLWGGNDISAM